MRFFKNETNGDLYLFVVNDTDRTISKMIWDSTGKIYYDADYGYSHLNQVENYESITEAKYFSYTDAINTAFRVGTRPADPP